jgi:hypothetical protein
LSAFFVGGPSAGAARAAAAPSRAARANPLQTDDDTGRSSGTRDLPTCFPLPELTWHYNRAGRLSGQGKPGRRCRPCRPRRRRGRHFRYGRYPTHPSKGGASARLLT